MDYSEILEHSYEIENTQSLGTEGRNISRLEYLSEFIFDFVTYDPSISELFAKEAVKVCNAINAGNTFDLIQDEDSYRWYLIMVNMPFFADKLEWGGSIRGAWWNTDGTKFRVDSCGLWVHNDQIDGLTFNHESWRVFIDAIVKFASVA